MLCDVACTSFLERRKDVNPVVFHLIRHLEITVSSDYTLPVLNAIVVPNMRSLRLTLLGIGLMHPLLRSVEHIPEHVVYLDLLLRYNTTKATIVMLLNHFPNITALDLSRCHSDVIQAVTEGLGDPQMHLPNLECIRMGWFVDDARARNILFAGRFAPECVLVSTTPELVYLTRILANETLVIVVE
ncbi:hypothetical protein B0H13DRAFT_105920 [Mycena leptocephala]|nr:hypothetical protein B0H13DRAFT_105920 [Mycena leptocephala]